MKKSRIFLIAFFFGAMIPSLACDRARETVQTPPGVQSPPISPLVTTIPLADTPIPASHTPTPLPSPTKTPVLTSSPTASPTTPILTSPPFLPARLVPIKPQNAAGIKTLAVLSEQGAGVVGFSPDSQWVAAGLFRGNEIKIWDLASGQELLSLSGHAASRIISYLAFSPDGSRLASCAQAWDAQNDSLILWDANAGRELQRFSGVLGAVSPDWGLFALTRREQDQGAALVLSDLASGEVLHTLESPGDIYGVAFSPDGRLLATHGQSDAVQLWAVTGE